MAAPHPQGLTAADGQTGSERSAKGTILSSSLLQCLLSPQLYCCVPAGAICDEHLCSLSFCLKVKLWSETPNVMKYKLYSNLLRSIMVI